MRKRPSVAMLILVVMMFTLVGCKESKKGTVVDATSTEAPTDAEATNPTVEPTEEIQTPDATIEPTKEPVAEEPTKEPVDSEGQQKVDPNIVLVIGSAPKDAVVLESETYDNGTYLEMLLVDGLVTLTMRGLIPTEHDLEARILEEYPDASDISINDSADPVGSYPTQRASFTTGMQEDTKSHVYVYIPTDTKVFTFDVAVPVDSFTEYQDLIEVWVSTLDIFDGTPSN